MRDVRRNDLRRQVKDMFRGVIFAHLSLLVSSAINIQLGAFGDNAPGFCGMVPRRVARGQGCPPRPMRATAIASPAP
jgi:hypothetical protein